MGYIEAEKMRKMRGGSWERVEKGGGDWVLRTLTGDRLIMLRFHHIFMHVELGESKEGGLFTKYIPELRSTIPLLLVPLKNSFLK